MRVLRTGVIAAALAAVVVPIGAAGGQAPELRLGGGALPGPVTQGPPARGVAIGLLVPAARDAVRLRVGFLIRCGRRLRGDDVLLRVPLNGDAFSGTRTVKSDEVRRATVAVSGTLAGDRATGTATITAAGCRRVSYRWAARSVSLGRPADAAPVVTPRTTLLGMTDAPGAIPHGVALKLSGNGRSAMFFTSAILRCRYAGRYARSPRKTFDVQQSVYVRVRGARASASYTGRQTATERRRGIRRSSRSSFAARFRGDVVTGAYRSTSRYRERGYSEQCVVPRIAFAAGP